ncbi:hypothetical protein PHYC_01239 [Phycisphaerales bacterium]|nr:hypothetical protein PHYC_01239 [Phycisphaerales bacterium]
MRLHCMLPAIALLAGASALAQPATPRGRDPWVFRCLFEDRTRMLIVAPRPNIWIAFNTATGAVHKAWEGEMVFRGKVWDFSQDSSAANGRMLLSRRDELCRMKDEPGLDMEGSEIRHGVEGPLRRDPSDWHRRGVSWSEGLSADAGNLRPDTAGWIFTPGAEVQSGAFDARGFTRLFVAFDEMSRKGPMRVEISNDAGESFGQWFDSTMHGSRDDEWQWNFRLIELEPTRHLRVHLRQQGDFQKRIRNVRVFGDEVAWWVERDGKTEPAAVEWRGHEVHTLKDMAVRLNVAGVEVKERLDAETPDGAVVIKERFEFGEIPAGTALRLRLPRLAGGTRTSEPVRAMQGDELVIEKAGVYEVVAKFERLEDKEDAR